MPNDCGIIAGCGIVADCGIVECCEIADRSGIAPGSRIGPGCGGRAVCLFARTPRLRDRSRRDGFKS